MSNLLFLVNLPAHVKPIGSEPDSALLRIHGQSDVEQLLSESVIFTMLSERRLGPKLLGVFPGGRFEQFIPSRCLQCEEIAYPTMSSVIGSLLARVHTLDVPITKEPNMIALAESWLAKLRLTESANREWELKPVNAKVNMETLPATFSCESLAKEMLLVKRCMFASGSPIVFCHNDLQEGNVLLYNKFEYTTDGGLRNTTPSEADEEPLVLIDFEYASYNYRGFDLANHFCEYGIDYDCKEPPCYKVHNEKFPNAEERRRFLSAYIDEVYKLRDSEDNPHFPLDLVTGNKEKDLETLVEESLRFMGVSHFFWTIWSLLQAEEGIVEDFDFHAYALDRLSLYYHNKKNLLKYIHEN
uniref:Choline/ethanolamine kinase n=1 Tax=Steinernema glaseri TaxID=37863 RepID=A0A1I7YLN0_9BILA